MTQIVRIHLKQKCQRKQGDRSETDGIEGYRQDSPHKHLTHH